MSASTAASRLVADLRYLRALLRQFRLTFLLASVLFGVVPLLYVWGWRGPSGQRVGWGAAAHHVYFLLFGNPSLPYTDSLSMEALNVLVPLFGVAVLADGVVRFGHLFFAKRGHAREWIAVRTQGMDQHVIVVGAGRVGYRVTEHLRALGREVVVLENRADAPLAAALREEGVPVLQEDARTPGALGRCNVARASAVVCSTDDDLVNLNVALDARRENPAIRVVIRVFDEDLARKVREGFGAEALSASGLAAPALAIAALDPRVAHSFQSGEHLFVVSRLRRGRPARGAHGGRAPGSVRVAHPLARREAASTGRTRRGTHASRRGTDCSCRRSGPTTVAFARTWARPRRRAGLEAARRRQAGMPFPTSSAPAGDASMARTRSTGQGAVRATFSATEPSTSRRMPVRPWLDITMRSVASSRANPTMASGAGAESRTELTVPPASRSASWVHSASWAASGFLPTCRPGRISPCSPGQCMPVT